MNLKNKIIKLADKIEGDNPLSVGVVGYSSELTLRQMDFALKNLRHIFANLDSPHNLEIVSGYTCLGVPAIAYEVAGDMCLKTVGIACKLCNEYDTYPVDEFIIVGDNWGDESEVFIDRIDFLIRIGGGDQSFKEVEMFKKKSGFKQHNLMELNI